MSSDDGATGEGINLDSSKLEFLRQALHALQAILVDLDYHEVSIASAHLNDAVEAIRREMLVLQSRES
jgi:hypothetical protein